MTKKVHILKDHFTNEKIALGISSTNSIFQIILELNNKANLDIKVTKPAMNKKKNEKYSYPHGSSNIDSNTIVHIFKNKQNGQILFSGLSSFDYIILFLGADTMLLFQTIMEILKEIPNITLLTKLEINQLRNLKDILQPFE